MHLHHKIFSSKRIKAIFRLTIVCFIIIFIQSSIVYGDTNTIEVMQLIGESLPSNLKLRSKGNRSITRKKSRFGKVNHVFIFIHKRDSKEPIINERSDGCIILLPKTYTYPSDDIKKQYEDTYITDTLYHKVFLLTDEKDIPTWNKFRENLKVNAATLLKDSESVK
jgi:hypothetical protein